MAVDILDASVVDACYNAAAAVDSWPTALEGLARSFGATACALHPRGAGDKRKALPASDAYREFLVEFVDGGWWRADHRAEQGWPLLQNGWKALIEHDISTEDDRTRLPLYRDLFGRFDLPWWGAAAVQTEGRYWVFSFLRSSAQGPFTQRDRQRLLALAPHLERIVGLSKRLVELNTRTLLDSMELLSTGAMVLDGRSRVLQLNARAEAFVGNGLSLRNGVLGATDRNSQPLFDRLVDSAAAAASPATALAIGPLRLPRPDGGVLIVDAVPTRGYVADALGYSGVLLMVSDPDQKAMPSAGRLQRAFDLTPAEARLAGLVGSGVAPAEAAQRLGIAEQTARTALKHVFVKTGVARQSELAALLGRLLPI